MICCEILTGLGFCKKRRPLIGIIDYSVDILSFLRVFVMVVLRNLTESTAFLIEPVKAFEKPLKYCR